MAKPKGNPPPLIFDTDTISGTPHWTPVWCSLHHFQNLESGLLKCPHGCPPGPQVRTLWTSAFEILGGGARYATKTETGRGFLLKGNFDEPAIHPNGEHIMHGTGEESYCGICTNISYITHPRYRALILRQNEKDLADWLDRAKLLYGPMGANVTEKPARVVWNSGATFVLGHMQDENSYTGYMGQEFQRIIFEELTQTADEVLYLKIRASCRSTFECTGKCKPGQCVCGALKPQIYCSANPGGKGHIWVKKRFISVGNPNEIYTDPLSKLTRIYIPGTVKDNPYALRNGQYEAQLNELPEPLRSAWLLGDWDALGGQYFRDFRPKGPLAGDPPGDAARHVIPEGSRALAPFWARWLGGDWGYDHNFAIYWACRDQNGQTIIYRELTGSQTSSSALGAAIGRACFRDLVAMEKAGVAPHMTFWLSPDAFSKDADEYTVAFHIAKGIDSVLGEGAAYIPEFWESFEPTVLNTGQSGPQWNQQDTKRAREQREFGITIEKANNNRVLGWQHMREMMRFRQLVEPNRDTYDNGYAMTLLHQNVDLYKEYLRSFEARKPEILPKLLIYDCCSKLIEAIPTAEHKEGTEDVLKRPVPEDDALDACRYLCFSEKVHQVPEPKQTFIQRRLDEIRKREPNIDYNGLVWVNRQIEEEYKKNGNPLKPFDVRVESSRLFRRGKVH